jgi:NADPH-dependent glutamate synthase beta subunit-like oxidoreductase
MHQRPQIGCAVSEREEQLLLEQASVALSLVVWAIREGRQAARAVDQALMGVSELPR